MTFVIADDIIRKMVFNEGEFAMIEIKKCDSLKGLENFGFDLYPNSVIMAAKEGDEILGAGEIIAYEGYAVLGRIFIDEKYKGFGFDFSIAKALLNMADLGGIRYIFSDMADELLAKKLRFTQNSESIPAKLPKICTRYKLFLDLNGYFTAHCG